MERVMRIVSDLLSSNVFVVGDEKSCFVVDAGASVEMVKNVVGERKVVAVLLTHGHFDHCTYVLDYLKTFNCKAYASENIREYLQNANNNYSDGKFHIDDFSNFVFLSGNGKIHLQNFDIEYFALGGHSKSDVCFKYGDEIFVGDLILGRDIGRIDLFGGNKDELCESLEFLIDLPYKIMHSGHGDDNSKESQDKVANLWLKFLRRLNG